MGVFAFTAAATFFSAFQVPYLALPAELTESYSQRTRLLTWRVVVLSVGILLFGAGGPEIRALFPRNPLLGYFVMGLVAGLMLAGAQYVATWILHDEKAVSLLFASLIAPAIIFSRVWKALADRIGEEKALRIASIGFMIAMLVLTVMIWIPGWWITIAVALAGASYAGMQTLPMAMLPDVISYHAAQNAAKQNSAGIFSGIWTAGETVGMALGPPVLSIILMQTGYLQSTAGVSAVQSDLALTGIATAFSIVPAVLMGFSLLTLRRYHLNETDIEGARRA